MTERYKERMKECINENFIFSECADIYEGCEDSVQIMSRLMEATRFYGEAFTFEKDTYLYEIHENALPKMAEIIIHKLVDKFDLDEEEAWMAVVELVCNSSTFN